MLFCFVLLLFLYYGLFLISTQDCFKASWSSHKAVHLKAKLSSLGTGTPHEQNSDLLNEDWQYCLKRGQARTQKLPHFDWTGYFSRIMSASYSTYPSVYSSGIYV